MDHDTKIAVVVLAGLAIVVLLAVFKAKAAAPLGAVFGYLAWTAYDTGGFDATTGIFAALTVLCGLVIVRAISKSAGKSKTRAAAST